MLLENRFKTVSGDTTKARIVVDPDLSKGRQRSMNGVYFGQLILDSEKSQHTELVAVKPLFLPKDAVREYGATVLVNDLSGPELPFTFTPLGFYREDTGSTALITRFEMGVRTFDNLFWNEEEPPSQIEVAHALGFCAAALGFMHANELVHGDASPRNIGKDGEVSRISDLTTMRSARSLDVFSARNLFLTDIKKLFDGVQDARTVDFTDRAVRELVVENFAEPYVDFAGDRTTLEPESNLRLDDINYLMAD